MPLGRKALCQPERNQRVPANEGLGVLQLPHACAAATNHIQGLRYQKGSERHVIRAKGLNDSRKLVDCCTRLLRGSRATHAVFQAPRQKLRSCFLGRCARRAPCADKRSVEVARARRDQSGFHEKLAPRNRTLVCLPGKLLESFTELRIGAERLRRPPAQLESHMMVRIAGEHATRVFEGR